jgi:hypothetical protein
VILSDRTEEKVDNPRKISLLLAGVVFVVSPRERLVWVVLRELVWNPELCTTYPLVHRDRLEEHEIFSDPPQKYNAGMGIQPLQDEIEMVEVP